MSPAILGYPKLGSKFILDTDASDKAVRAVLSQEQDGQEKVIAYMNKHKQSYCVTRKILFAVDRALRNFHSYLYGQPVLLRTEQVERWLQDLDT